MPTSFPAKSSSMLIIEWLGQARPQLAFVTHREQHDLSLRMGVQHDVTRQHEFAQIGVAKRSGPLLCLLRLKLPPTGLGLEESRGATACSCE
ncbi:hypothetical protein BH11PSE13_BH11PSE13_11130 [soil metagenome]